MEITVAANRHDGERRRANEDRRRDGSSTHCRRSRTHLRENARRNSKGFNDCRGNECVGDVATPGMEDRATAHMFDKVHACEWNGY